MSTLPTIRSMATASMNTVEALGDPIFWNLPARQVLRTLPHRTIAVLTGKGSGGTRAWPIETARQYEEVKRFTSGPYAGHTVIVYRIPDLDL
jgi:hypothetical protein